MIRDIITNQSVPNAVLYGRCLPFDFGNKTPALTGGTVGEQDRATAAEVVTDLLDTAELHRNLSAFEMDYPDGIWR